jgi:hypothetical protein
MTKPKYHNQLRLRKEKQRIGKLIEEFKLKLTVSHYMDELAKKKISEMGDDLYHTKHTIFRFELEIQI